MFNVQRLLEAHDKVCEEILKEKKKSDGRIAALEKRIKDLEEDRCMCDDCDQRSFG